MISTCGEKMKKKQVLAVWAITLISLMTFTSIGINSPAMAQPSNASLTGRIFDHGKDTDGDGLFNFLIVDVEVNVVVAGIYKVSVTSLADYNGYYSLYFNSANETHLSAGLKNVSLSFDGIAIYGNKLDAAYVGGVTLSYSVNYTQYIQTILQIPLSKTYSYTLFDNGATLTGKIYDKGVDADGDGRFDFLQIGVQVNVSDEALYRVNVWGLVNGSGPYRISVYNNTEAHLMPGVQTLNVSLDGAAIYASHATSISNVSSINLEVVENYTSFTLDSKIYVPMNRTYSYAEFETPAYFTGKTFDEGVHTNASSKFDYLRLSFEINVTEAGNYALQVQSLMDNASNSIPLWDEVSGYYDVGPHLVNISIYGPRIYLSHLNVTHIGAVSLYRLPILGGPWLTVDSLSNVPLHRLYKYTDFESDALLTGKISDMGVDTDRDGLFDYLAVGIEINVTKPGVYRVSANELTEKVAYAYYRYLYAYSSAEANFSLGLHTVYLNFSGPMLAEARFSPTNISDLFLSEGSPYFLQLGYIPSALLSKKYDYTLFDAPLRDMHVNFTVYPNGTLGVGGAFNYTHMYPQNTGPLVNTSLSISTVGETTTGSANGTIVFPKGGMYGWPYNSTTAAFRSHYDGGLSDDRLNATIFMPPAGRTTYPTNSSAFSLNSAYSNGLLDVNLHGETTIPSYGSMFPFNVTDLVVRADYTGNELKGNITFRAASGLPLGDIVVYFNGNKTNLDFTGNVTVVYGNYFGMEINSTTVESMLDQLNSTLLGPTGSVYNMTQGLLECTKLNTTKTPLFQGMNEYGAEIKYEATIHGNFTGFLAQLLTQVLFGSYSYTQGYPTMYAALDSALSSVQKASLVLNYYHTSGIASIDLGFTSDVKALWSTALQLVPPTAPTEARTQVEAWLKVANATAYAIKAFSFNASYSSTAQKLDVEGRLLTNVTQLNKDEIPIMPDTVPEQLRGMVESYLNTTYCNLTSSNATFNFKNGTGNFAVDWILKGDFKAQLNYVKQFYINYFNATAPWMFTSQLRVLNETEININNFSAEVKIGKDRMYATFNGLILKPPRETVDSIRFRLGRFLNVTAGLAESPMEFEKLGITITGGSNATHTVLLYAPSATPSPDSASPDHRTMTWRNTTLSSLKGLVFEIAYQNAVNYGGETQPVLILSNSTVSNFNFKPGAKSISFNVTGVAGKGFINITIPRSLLYAAIGNWTVKIDGKVLTQPENYTVTENADYVFIHLVYSHSSHLIEIQGTWVVTEFPTGTLLLFLTAAAMIAAVIMFKQRRRLGTLKLKCESAVSMFLDRLHQQRT
jgi:hypothetical protein